MEFILAVSLVVVIALSLLIIAVSEVLLKQKDEEIAWFKYLAERNRDIIVENVDLLKPSSFCEDEFDGEYIKKVLENSEKTVDKKD